MAIAGPIAVAKPLKAPPQSNKVRVPPSPTSRTRVMIGERRDRGAGPPAEEDVVLRDIHRCLGKRRSSSRPGSRGVFGRRGRPERVRGVPQIDRGKGRNEYQTRVVSRRPSTDRLSDGRPRGARRPRSVIRQADAFWRVRWPFADRSRGPRPFDLWARGGLSSGAAPGPGSAGREPSSGAPVSRAAPHS